MAHPVTTIPATTEGPLPQLSYRAMPNSARGRGRPQGDHHEQQPEEAHLHAPAEDRPEIHRSST